MKNSRFNYPCQDNYVQHSINSNTRNQNQHRIHHTPGPIQFLNNNQILKKKQTAEEFGANNQKRLHNIFGQFLYHARAIEPTMLMVLNSLEAVQTKLTIQTAKKSIIFLYCVSHPDAVTEYRISDMIQHIYSYASSIS